MGFLPSRDGMDLGSKAISFRLFGSLAFIGFPRPPILPSLGFDCGTGILSMLSLSGDVTLIASFSSSGLAWSGFSEPPTGTSGLGLCFLEFSALNVPNSASTALFDLLSVSGDGWTDFLMAWSFKMLDIKSPSLSSVVVSPFDGASVEYVIGGAI